MTYFGGQTQMVVKMVVRPIANLSEEARCNGSKELSTILGSNKAKQTLCLDAVLKAHLRRDQLRGVRRVDGSKLSDARDPRHRSKHERAAALERGNAPAFQTASCTRLG